MQKRVIERIKQGMSGAGTAYLLSTYCMQSALPMSPPLIQTNPEEAVM